MEKLEVMYNALKQAEEEKKELISGYKLSGVRKAISSKDFSTYLRILLYSNDGYFDEETQEYHPSTKRIDLTIEEEGSLFFVGSLLYSSVNSYEFETINNLTFEEIIPSFKEVEHKVKEAEKKLDKEIEESNKIENLLLNQINNL